jgi:hypothetical protein
MKYFAVVTLLVVLVACAGCSFVFYESKVTMKPVASPPNDRVAISGSGQIQMSPEVISAFAKILVLLPLEKWFTGEGLVKREVNAGNANNKFGTEYTTTRTFLKLKVFR